MMNFESEIKLEISEQLGIKLSQISNDKSFIKDLKADSMDMVALLLAIEERLNLVIEDTAAEKMQTVQDVIDYVNSKKPTS